MDNLLHVAGLRHSVMTHQFITAESRLEALKAFGLSKDAMQIVEGLDTEFKALKEDINKLTTFKIIYLKLTRLLEIEEANNDN